VKKACAPTKSSGEHCPINDSVDAKKLGQAVESLASTIIEIIESRLRQFAEEGKLRQPDRLAGQPATCSVGWVDQKAVAEHLHISRRTLFDWMQRGKIPYMRIGNRPRFMLRDVDEALKRQYEVRARF